MDGELEAIRQLKARYCRYLDTKDIESWRPVFTTDVVVTLDMAVSTGGADPMTAPPLEGVDMFVSAVLAGIGNAATMHQCHTPEITLTSDRTATGILFGRWKTVWSTRMVASCAAPVTTTRPTRSGTARGGSRVCI